MSGNNIVFSILMILLIEVVIGTISFFGVMWREGGFDDRKGTLKSQWIYFVGVLLLLPLILPYLIGEGILYILSEFKGEKRPKKKRHSSLIPDDYDD